MQGTLAQVQFVSLQMQYRGEGEIFTAATVPLYKPQHQNWPNNLKEGLILYNLTTNYSLNKQKNLAFLGRQTDFKQYPP